MRRRDHSSQQHGSFECIPYHWLSGSPFPYGSIHVRGKRHRPRHADVGMRVN